MVGHLIKLCNSFNVSAYYSLFFFKYSNITVNFSIAKLVILEIPQGLGNLILTFVIEKNKKSSCVVIDLKLSAHGLFYSPDKSAGQDNIVDWVTIELTHIIRSRSGIHNHSYSNWCEHFSFFLLIVLDSTRCYCTTTRVHLLGIEKPAWSKI